ncbi:contractile injection system protein, VgrG/Pvc8 family, partial [Yersinia pestis]
MFAHDKANNNKAADKTGTVTPTHIVSPEAAPTVSGAQMTEMAGGIGDAVGGTAGKRINQAAEVAKTALDAKAKVLDGGVTPTNIVATGPAPTVSGAQMTEMAGGIGDAVGGTAGKRINQAAEVAKTALEAKAKVLDGGVTPMNLAAGGAGAGLPDSAAAAVKQPSGLQFTLTTASLPPQTFAVVDFTLSEMLSSPFVLNVGLASADPAVDFAAVLDEDATLFIWREGVLQRSITGMVASFEQGDTGFHQTRYSMVIRPALWRTSLRRNAR